MRLKEDAIHEVAKCPNSSERATRTWNSGSHRRVYDHTYEILSSVFERCSSMNLLNPSGSANEKKNHYLYQGMSRGRPADGHQKWGERVFLDAAQNLASGDTSQ